MKKTSWKILVVFWLIAIILLAGWYVFLQIKYKNIENLKPLTKIAPLGDERKNEIQTLLDIYAKIGGANTKKTLLVLFQNNLELRPGGGFIGAFGIAKVENGKIIDIQVFDTGNFDKNIPDTETPPAPIAEILGAKAWYMRDSNWSPDFKINAEKGEYFYNLGGGRETINGVVAINTDVLNSLLSITGPVKIDDYPGEYKDENAILQLEYQVEKGYAEQGIAKEERKNIMGELAETLAEKAHNFTFSQQMELAKKVETHLKQKDIQLFFKDEDLQKQIEKTGWAGQVKDTGSDYFLVVDANLNALKSDYCIKRRMDYTVDFSNSVTQAVLEITYEHTCRVKDWMTSDYRDWLRVYVPKGSFLEEIEGQTGDVRFADELGKKVFGMSVSVPLGEAKTVSLKYRLPETIKSDEYKLLIQKQSGSGDVPVEISVKKQDGSEMRAQEILTGDKIFPL